MFLLYLLPLGYAQQDTTVERLYQEGKTLYYEGQYLQARELLLEALSRKESQDTGPDEQLLDLYARLGKTDRRLRVHQRAIAYLKQAENLAANLHGDASEELADVYFDLGTVYSQMFDPISANVYFQKCQKIYSLKYGDTSSEVGNLYMNFGINAIKQVNYQDAEGYFQQAFDIFKESSPPESQDFNRIYSNMGVLYRKMGNYDKAIEFGTKALELKLLHYKPDHPSVAKYHGNIGRALQAKGQPEKALPYMKTSVAILEKSLGPEHPETGGAYAEMAGVYADLGQYETARTLYEKGNQILGKTLATTHPYVVGGYFNIGRLFEDQGDYLQALDYYQDVLKRFQSAPYAPPNLLAITQEKIAEMYFKSGRLEEAMDAIRGAMGALAPEFEVEAHPHQNPPLGLVRDRLDFLAVLQTKSNILYAWYQQNQQQAYLSESFESLNLAVALIEEIKKGYFSQEDQKLLFARSEAIFTQSIHKAFELHARTGNKTYLFQAFALSEKGKSNFLWQNLQAGYALQASGIPDEELNAIDLLRSELAGLEESFLENPSAEIQSQLVDLKIQYQERIKTWENYNPKYYELKYASPQLDLQRIQDKLAGTNTGLLEYYYEDNQLSIFLITENDIIGSHQEVQVDLAELIQQLRLPNTISAASYIQTLNALYSILIGPVRSELEDLEDLVVIPHGVLHYLSFEELAPVSSDTDFRKLPYLIRNHTVIYAWSAAFWMKPIKSSSVGMPTYLGFAPEFSSQINASNYRAALSVLPNAQTEVNNGAALFDGRLFVGTEASESHFLEWAPQYRILHLATHALANEQEPLRSGLWFSNARDSLEDGYLNALEIYNLNLSADLAVMSACNTGFGQLAAGEGVMSLGRAFSYAGCKSVLMSLWLANDHSTSTIISHFYDYSKKGLPKDAALREAKLDYLNQADALTANPYFWSHLVLVGDAGPLKPVSGHWLYWLLGGLCLFILLVLRVRKGNAVDRVIN